jgi:hypothetical protein
MASDEGKLATFMQLPKVGKNKFVSFYEKLTPKLGCLQSPCSFQKRGWLYVDRAAGSNRHHWDFGSHALAGVGTSQGES